MNHGVVIIGEALDSRIWEMAMDHGQFIAMYTRKHVGDSNLWHSAFVPTTTGEALRFLLLDVNDPRYQSIAKYDQEYEDYARYEPQYDQQFFKMCRCVDGDTVVVPSVTNDQEAMRILHEIHSVRPEL